MLAGNWHCRWSKRCRRLRRRKCSSSSAAAVFGSLELCSVPRLCLSGSRRRLSSNTVYRIYIGFQPPPRGTGVPRETVATVRRFHFPTFFSLLCFLCFGFLLGSVNLWVGSVSLKYCLDVAVKNVIKGGWINKIPVHKSLKPNPNFSISSSLLPEIERSDNVKSQVEHVGMVI